MGEETRGHGDAGTRGRDAELSTPLADQLSAPNLLRSLASATCPACGHAKEYHKSLCLDCYRYLSPDRQHALYQRIDHGYDRAMLEALKVLGAKRFILPRAAQWGMWEGKREGTNEH